MSILQSVRGLGTGNQALMQLKEFQTPLPVVVFREGRAGQIMYYVTHQYVTDVLNQITGFNWSNHVIKDYLNGDEVAVLCRLKVQIGDIFVEHDGWGGGVIARYGSGERKGEIIRRALADAYNAATSLALTKASSRLGIGLDLGIVIQPDTLRQLNINGSKLFTEKWDEVRPLFVRAATPGRQKDGEDLSSSRDLRDIEARILIHIMLEWAKSMTQKGYNVHYANLAAEGLADTLRPTAKTALLGN